MLSASCLPERLRWCAVDWRWGAFARSGATAFLLISAGLWVAAVLHVLHFAAYTGALGPADSLLGAALVLRGQLLPTLFFTLFLALSLLAGRQDRPSNAQPGGVFLAAATLGFIVTVGALVFPVPQAGDVLHLLGQTIPSLAAHPELLLITGLAVVGIAGPRPSRQLAHGAVRALAAAGFHCNVHCPGTLSGAQCVAGGGCAPARRRALRWRAISA